MPIRSDDQLAIMDVLVRYCNGCDLKKWDLFGDVFVEDAQGIYHGATFGSRAEIVEHVRTHLGGVGHSQHLVSNFDIRIEGDEATSRCILRAWHEGTGDWEGVTYEAFGEYSDVLRRTSAGWRIARRVLVVHAQLGTRDMLGP